MKPIVSIIMGSTSDLPVMEKAAKLLDEMQVPFEMNALQPTVHRLKLRNSPRKLQDGASRSSLLLPEWLLHCPESLLPIQHFP